MYFGLCNFPATFQLMMDSLFRDLVNEGKIVIYMDDILIFSKTLTEHRVIVRKVLRILNNNKLSVQTKKCRFHQTRIDYLGIIISKDSIEVDPEKIKEVTDWPKPRNKCEIRQFLGFCNFYWRFIKGFAKVAKPLTELTGKKEWRWTQEERRAFEKLKRLMTTTPILAIPDPERKLRVEVDASGHTIGRVLSQLQPDESWRPISYIS